MAIHIKQPETEEEFKHYYHLRWKLLRAPWKQPEGSEIDSIENQCLHLMAINDDKSVIAVARLQSNSDIEAQIRYMAVEKKYERRGIGRQLINAIEHHARSNNHQHIVLDARESAIDFYKSLNYIVIKKSYLLFGEIQHYRMQKTITND